MRKSNIKYYFKDIHYVGMLMYDRLLFRHTWNSFAENLGIVILNSEAVGEAVELLLICKLSHCRTENYIISKCLLISN
jgi:hypothetical protein